MKKITGILIFSILIAISGIGQDLPKKTVSADKKKISQEKQKIEQVQNKKAEKKNQLIDNKSKADPQGLKNEKIKSVPATKARNDLIKKLNKKRTMGQMHKINKAMRKSIRRHRR